MLCSMHFLIPRRFACNPAGLRSVSIMWGAWATGMAAKDATTAQRFQRLGMGTIAPHTGLAALGQLLRSSAAEPQARMQPLMLPMGYLCPPAC